MLSTQWNLVCGAQFTVSLRTKSVGKIGLDWVVNFEILKLVKLNDNDQYHKDNHNEW